MAATANRGAGALSRFAHFAGITKTKADETPSQDEHDELEEKVETVDDKVDELEERVDEVEDDVEDDKPDADEPEKDKPEARKAYRSGRANGRKMERARAGAILATAVAAKNRNLALHLAFETAMPAKQAVALLKASAAGAPAPAAPVATPTPAPAPAPRKESALDARMDASTPVKVGSGASASGPDTTTHAGLAAHALAVAKRAGVVK